MSGRAPGGGTLGWHVTGVGAPPPADLAALAEQTGLAATVAAGQQLTIDVATTGAPLPDGAHGLSDERFRIRNVPGDALRVRVEASSRRGLRWAMVELARRRDGDAAGGIPRSITVDGGPAFAIRGVIEGFYGPPWSPEQRLDLIDFCAAERLNTFMYAPKDDPYLRDRWREPHAAAALERLQATVARCRGNDVTAMVGVSPGLSMQYSSATDRRLLDAKVLALLDLGVDHIALLYDDIPTHLQHEADVAAYRSLAEAHADVANHLAATIGGRAPMVVCPTQYSGTGDEEYVLRLGSLLDTRIDLFWTGRQVCSPAITAAEAVAFARSTSRPPLYWDNYPVNDADMTNEAHLGPYRGRDPMLDRVSAGLLANAMEYPEASKIALATIADYLWDPAGYDPEQSWERALAVVGGPDSWALRHFADTVRGSCLSGPEPVEIGRQLEQLEVALASGSGVDAAREQLGELATQLGRAAAVLRAPDAFNRRLANEMAPWLDKFAVGADALAALATVAGRAADEPDAAATLRTLADEFARLPQQVYGGVLQASVDRALA